MGAVLPGKQRSRQMHSRGYYQNLNEHEIANKLSGEGGIQPKRVQEGPNSRYDGHKNSNDLILAFISGSATIRVGEKIYECAAGDQLVVQGGTTHSAEIGTDGCVYYMTQLPTRGD
jgi:mannose-6-phosphate isomerase-like protein (cupin superfamily)